MFNKWEPRSLEKMEVSVSIVHTTLIQAMSKFSPLLNRILKDLPLNQSIFQLLQEGEIITSSYSEVLMALELLNLNINSDITSYRIPPVQKQKQH